MRGPGNLWEWVPLSNQATFELPVSFSEAEVAFQHRRTRALEEAPFHICPLALTAHPLPQKPPHQTP